MSLYNILRRTLFVHFKIFWECLLGGPSNICRWQCLRPACTPKISNWFRKMNKLCRFSHLWYRVDNSVIPVWFPIHWPHRIHDCGHQCRHLHKKNKKVWHKNYENGEKSGDKKINKNCHRFNESDMCCLQQSTHFSHLCKCSFWLLPVKRQLTYKVKISRVFWLWACLCGIVTNLIRAILGGFYPISYVVENTQVLNRGDQ